MEGVGARVVRGPDWKWGKQVRTLNFTYINIVCAKNEIEKNDGDESLFKNFVCARVLNMSVSDIFYNI